MEGFRDEVQQFGGVLDDVRVLSDDPDHGCACPWFIDQLHGAAHRDQHRRVFPWVKPEQVGKDEHDLLDDVADLALEEVEQNVDASVGGGLEFDGAARDGADRRADEGHVRLHGVLLELAENALDVARRGEADEQLELLHLDVVGVVVLAEEDLNRRGHQVRNLLDDQTQVAQRHVAQLRALDARQRHQRVRQLVQRGFHELFVAVLDVQQNHLHRARSQQNRGNYPMITAVLACCRRGATRSMMRLASASSCGM